MRAALLFCLIALSSLESFAGFVEVGASASYRKTSVTEKVYSQSESYTGSLGYYFTEATAIELSYTQGFAQAMTLDSETRAYFTIYGADLIITIGAKDAFFRPYVKGGAAYVYKEIYYTQTGFPPTPPIKSAGLVPSAGAGFRILLSSNFAIKVGAEVQSSPVNDTEKREGETRNTVYDIAGRAGVSWMF